MLVLRLGAAEWGVRLRYLIDEQRDGPLDAAWSVGHEENLPARVRSRVAVFSGLAAPSTTSFSAVLVSEPALRGLVLQLSRQIDRPMRDAQLRRAPESWSVVAEQTGLRLDE